MGNCTGHTLCQATPPSALVGTLDVIRGFDIGQEVVRIFAQKAPAGHGAHSDFCQVAGRKVNDWLADPEEVPAFLTALEHAGWIKKNQPAANSRFWNLLQGDRAEMFGVFSPYELQVIHDWLRGDASADGAAFEAAAGAHGTDGLPQLPRRPVSFRVAERLRQARAGRSGTAGSGIPAGSTSQWLDTDLSLLRERLPTLCTRRAARPAGARHVSRPALDACGPGGNPGVCRAHVQRVNSV